MASGNAATQHPAYYHGGAQGLKPGTVLLSKSQAAKQGMSTYWQPRAGGQYSPDHVYFTTDLDLARAFAHSLDLPSGTGSVYEVRPDQPIEPDPDYGGSTDVYMARRAVVARVVQHKVQMTGAQETQVFASRQMWDGNRPYMDANGIVQPSEQMQNAGWNAVLLKMLPPWTAFDDLGAELSRLAVTETAAVLMGSPGIGDVDRARWHKACGLTDDAITALFAAHFGFISAIPVAKQRPVMSGVRSGETEPEPRRNWLHRMLAGFRP
jgi:hypothetical protein